VVVDPAAAGYSQAASIPPSINFACKSVTRINQETRASHCSPAKFADALRLNHRAKLHRILRRRGMAFGTRRRARLSTLQRCDSQLLTLFFTTNSRMCSSHFTLKPVQFDTLRGFEIF
jgi:hypothetical protein